MKIKNIKVSIFIFTLVLVTSFSLRAYSQNINTSDKNIFLDFDQDGLSDEEEKLYGTDSNNSDTDGDGYSDGIEIKSGYDPLKPAPGDKIITSNTQDKNDIKESSISQQSVSITEKDSTEEKNLTEELSLEISKLISERSAEQQEITLNDLDSLIQKSIGEVLTFEDLPDVSDDEIIIKKQNYSKLSEEKRIQKEKEDALEYLTALSYIIVNNLPQKINSVEDFEKLVGIIDDNINLFVSSNFTNIAYFQNLAEKNEKILLQISEIEVPESLLDLHKKGIQICKYAINLKNEINPDPKDPVSIIVNISKVQNLISLSMMLSEEIIKKMESLGIEKISI